MRSKLGRTRVDLSISTKMETEEVEGQLAQLAQQLNCMGTDDEETLVRNFQQLLSPHADLSPDLCRFFLDMNNWNLQGALGSFYDYNAQQMVFQSLPAMQFVADVTVGEGESIPPNTRFVKTWRVRNSGVEQWSTGSCLRHIEGDLLADVDHVMVEALKPGEVTDVSLMMASPAEQGTYQSRWRMFTGAGLPFGEPIWCIIVVDNSGLLDLTQRFASTSCRSGQQPETPAQWSFGSNGIGPVYHGASDGAQANPQHRNPFQSGIKDDGPRQQAQSNVDGGSEQKPLAVESGSSGGVESARRGDLLPPPVYRLPMTAESAIAAPLFEFGRCTVGVPMHGECYPIRKLSSDFAGIPRSADTIDSAAESGASGTSKQCSFSELQPPVILQPPSSANMGAVSVVQPLQPLYGASSNDDDMEN